MSDNLARAEREALCDTLTAVGPDAPTLCGSWRTQDLAAHLVIRERRPDLALGILVSPLAAYTERGQDAYAARPWSELVETVRSGPPAWSPTRIGRVDEVANLVEFTVHHEDVLRAGGVPNPGRTLDDRAQDALWAALTRMARVLARSAPDGVRFSSPGRADIVVGEGAVTVTGAPLELLLTAYGRGNVADTEVSGTPDAVRRFEEAELGL